MARTCFVLCVLGLTTGCGDSGSPPGRASPASNRVEDTKAPEIAGKGQQMPPVPKTNSHATKTIGVKTGRGSTRFEIGNPRDVRVDLERDKPLFYPVLRNFDEGDFFTLEVAHSPVAKGLGVFACRKTKRPNGGTGIDYVMRSQLTDYGIEESNLIKLCYDNFFKDKVEVKALKQGDDLMLSVSSTGGLVTALLGHSSTYERFSGMLGTEEMAVLIDGPDILLATAKGSSFETRFYELVKKSHHKEDALNLDPAVYHWTKREGLTPVSGPPGGRPPGP
jgi:hypothetical protein